jgi:hypothetical protein
MASIPTSFMISNRTTATPRDLSVDSNRTNVTRGTRLWDKISITSQNFSYDHIESWWQITNGIRGVGGVANLTVPQEQNTLGNQLVVGGGLVFAHHLYSFNCQNLYFTTSWETGTYNALWGVWASNDQVKWTLMKSTRFTDSNSWTPSSSDGGILSQGPGTGTYNRFYKFSWVNTQYYVYWKIGIIEIGNQVVSGYSQPAAGLGCLYEIEWG